MCLENEKVLTVDDVDNMLIQIYHCLKLVENCINYNLDQPPLALVFDYLQSKDYNPDECNRYRDFKIEIKHHLNYIWDELYMVRGLLLDIMVNKDFDKLSASEFYRVINNVRSIFNDKD